MKKQTRKSVKRLPLDKVWEFGVWDLESWTKDKKIKVELPVAYSLKMNNIAKYTNILVSSQARCLFLDAAINIS